MIIVKTGESNKKPTKKQIREFLEDYAMKQIMKKHELSHLADGFVEIERHNIRVTDLVMDSDTYVTEIRKQTDIVDPITDRKFLIHDYFCNVWGARVWIKKTAKPHEIKMYGEGDKQLAKDFPQIVKSKKILKIKD